MTGFPQVRGGLSSLFISCALLLGKSNFWRWDEKVDCRGEIEFKLNRNGREVKRERERERVTR